MLLVSPAFAQHGEEQPPSTGHINHVFDGRDLFCGYVPVNEMEQETP